jgi:cytochrome P450 family 97 subfamily B polypeptide 3
VELAGGPLFLMLEGYAKIHGSIFKLTFGPKSFMIISDPVIAKHILKENPLNYDKGDNIMRILCFPKKILLTKT